MGSDKTLIAKVSVFILSYLLILTFNSMISSKFDIASLELTKSTSLSQSLCLGENIAD